MASFSSLEVVGFNRALRSWSFVTSKKYIVFINTIVTFNKYG